MKSTVPRSISTTLLAVTLLALVTTSPVSGAGSAGAPGTSASLQQNSSSTTATASSIGTTSFRAAATKSVNVTVDVLSNRHAISPYVYGFAYPSSTADIADSGATEVRWAAMGLRHTTGSSRPTMLPMTGTSRTSLPLGLAMERMATPRSSSPM